ncbi:MAG: hypothetical protein Kow0069_30610 [Promethearchaeota archaeon]
MEDFLSDFTRLYILLVLFEQPRHGYGIISTFRERLGKEISPSLVYPFLKRLKQAGLVTVESEQQGERERKKYVLTEKGLDFTRRLFRRFASIVSQAIEPTVTACVHCGAKLYDGGHVEEVDGEELVFCCTHCAGAYKKLPPGERVPTFKH